MKYYNYNRDTGEFIDESEAQIDGPETSFQRDKFIKNNPSATKKDVEKIIFYSMPGSATLNPPPKLAENQKAFFSGEDWEIRDLIVPEEPSPSAPSQPVEPTPTPEPELNHQVWESKKIEIMISISRGISSKDQKRRINDALSKYPFFMTSLEIADYPSALEDVMEAYDRGLITVEDYNLIAGCMPIESGTP